MTSARIDRLAYIGWRGIHGCEVLQLDEGPLTGLIGPSGAGKTTLVMCLDYALLPDRKVLDIKPISDLQDSKNAGLDTLSSRIDPQYGYAYTALDITTRLESRVIAGIFVQSVDGAANFTRWVIKNASKDLPLQDLLSITDGDSEYYPAFPELKRNLAAKGIDIVTCRSVSEYGQALYEAGILPSNMSLASDRTLYANLIETTFKGGISKEVTNRLKEYLLPEASQIPEIVRGLEECTNELIKTRSAVKEANKELDLLRATYGVGREMTLHAIRSVLHDISIETKSVADLFSQHSNANEELRMTREIIPQLEKEIKALEETKKTAVQNANFQLKQLHDNQLQLVENYSKLDARLTAAIRNKSLYDKCAKIWRIIGEKNGLTSFDSATRWLREQEEVSQKKIVAIDLKVEKLQEERARLLSGHASQASELLAEKTGGVSLEHALKDVDESDALAIEMGLAGMIEGVVGVEINALPHLSASEEIPEIFWLGKKTPSPSELHEVGDWFLSTTASGYIVANKKHRSVFGSAARDRRRDAIQAELNIFSNQRKNSSKNCDDYRALSVELATNKDGILYYLLNKENEQTLIDDVKEAQESFDKHKEDLAIARAKSEKMRELIENIQLPYEQQAAAVQVELNNKNTKAATLQNRVKQYSDNLALAQNRLSLGEAELQSIQAILVDNFESMFHDAMTLSDFKQEGLVNIQAKRLSKLNDALRNESPARLQKLQDVNMEDRVSLVRVWPVLLEIVREFVHTDLADIIGVDFIQAMQERRANLDGELVKQENEVKIKARNIYAAIRSNVQSQRKKLEKLSEFGKHIQFGNVIGIQINLVPRDDMLQVLEEFSQQTSLFSDQRPIDEVLRDFLQSSLIRKIDLTGEALLDYRNYVDLVIEAMRKNGDWEPASALSGGEAIGCGLAIALMLTRSIAAKGEIKVDQISPLFAVDEVQRLHPEGQTLLVDFAKREGFQILVTATTMEPGFKCTLYALNRIYEPDERLVIRGVKVKRDANNSPAIRK